MRKGNRNEELVHRTELGGRECGTGEDTGDRRLKLKTLEQDIGQETLEQEGPLGNWRRNAGSDNRCGIGICGMKTSLVLNDSTSIRFKKEAAVKAFESCSCGIQTTFLDPHSGAALAQGLRC